MNGVPFALPECGEAATVRMEVVTPAGLGRPASLDAAVYACGRHVMDVAVAIWSADLSAHRACTDPGITRICGDSYVFPTGGLAGNQ
ncbi:MULTISPECIES: hypothetical protein [unclassified Micromonospora]|uniref:hypothetical protein n=1 Tax=Micromonospora TaxID=1873 RepID=UPI0024161186|nr:MULTISPECIES: hypothetical protein [unclassified Micromonospora]MDG4818154.1 hypothetical protein [Micromonospora sp. WMMD956]WFE60716.1 hypothetical protein O7633_29455 [Micromonospora sp. WMMD712]